MDLVFGTYNNVMICLQDSSGAISFYDSLVVTCKKRPTAELVDFNGDGLLDIVTAAHQSLYEFDRKQESRIEVFLNKGTKNKPLFKPDSYFNLSVGGKIVQDNSPNGNSAHTSILFSDLNNDNKKDLLFYSTYKYTVPLMYALNVSNNDSIVLGDRYPIKFNQEDIIVDSLVMIHRGYKLALAYYDTDNDGQKEFYFNNINGYKKYSVKGIVDVQNDINNIDNNIESIQQVGNKIILNNSIENAKISIIDLKGRVVGTRIITVKGKNEITLKNLSPGSYFLCIKNSDINQTLKFVKVE